MESIIQLGEYNPFLRTFGPGATGTLYNICGKNLLIDCGAGFTSNEGGELYSPNLEYLEGKRIDKAFLTHLHFDHLGMFPLFSRQHPETEIIMSLPTFYGSSVIVFPDTLKIWKQDARQAERLGRNFEPPYTEEDVEKFFERVGVIQRTSEWSFDGFPGWKFWFDKAGHEPGAMSIFISPPEGPNFAITGDISKHKQAIIGGERWFENPLLQGFWEESAKKGLILVTEATNGARRVPDHRLQAEVMVKRLLQAEQDGAYTALFPSFAFNRAANNAMWITRLSSELGRPLNPHVDGLARKVIKHYMAMSGSGNEWSPEDIPLYEELSRYIAESRIVLFGESKHCTDKTGKETKELSDKHRELVASGSDPCGCTFSPIISPSASMDKGFAIIHGKRILPERKNLLVLTGHIFNETPSEELMKYKTNRLEKGWTIKLGGEPVPVACEVEKYDFSAHDGGDVLVERVFQTGAKHVIWHHADDDNGQMFEAGVEAKARASGVTSPKISAGRFLVPVEI